MTVQFSQSVVGSGWGFNAGDVADLPEDQAFNVLRAGFAEVVAESTAIATATVNTAVETATLKTAKRK